MLFGILCQISKKENKEKEYMNGHKPTSKHSSFLKITQLNLALTSKWMFGGFANPTLKCMVEFMDSQMDVLSGFVKLSPLDVC